MIAMTGLKGDIGSSLLELYRKDNIPILDYSYDNLDSVTRVFHLAAKSFPSTNNEIIESNILYTIRLIEELEAKGINEVIFFSAMSVYGQQTDENLNEKSSFCSPEIYGLSKLISEELFKNSNINVLVIRLPAILGNKNKTNVISRWYQKLIVNKDISYYNENKLFNNFISVESIFEFLKGFEFQQKFDVINLASKKDMTIKEILNTMAETIASKSNLINAGESSYFSISTKKAETKYNFSPEPSKKTLLEWIEKRKNYEY